MNDIQLKLKEAITSGQSISEIHTRNPKKPIIKDFKMQYYWANMGWSESKGYDSYVDGKSSSHGDVSFWMGWVTSWK